MENKINGSNHVIVKTPTSKLIAFAKSIILKKNPRIKPTNDVILNIVLTDYIIRNKKKW